VRAATRERTQTAPRRRANSINPDGIRAQDIIESLEGDIQEEPGHARRFGERIKELLPRKSR
jgi:hypothetical protein